MSRPEFKRGSSRDSGAPRASLVVKDDDGNVLTAPTAAKQDSALQSIAKQIEAQNAAKEQIAAELKSRPRDAQDALKAAQEKNRSELSRLRQERSKLQDALAEAERHRASVAKEEQIQSTRVEPATIVERITALEKKISSGTLTLVEEKKAGMEVAQLKRQLTAAESQKLKDASSSATKASQPLPAMSVEKARKGLQDVEKLVAAAEAALEEADKAVNNFWEADRARRKELQEKQQSIAQAVSKLVEQRRELHSSYDAQRAAYNKFLQRALKEQAAKDKEAALAQRRAERLLPKFEDEIAELATLIRHLERTYLGISASASSESTQETSPAAADADEALLINRRGRVEEDDSFMAPSNKKKTSKSAAKPASTPSTVRFDVVTLHRLHKYKVSPPAAVSEVETTVEQLKTVKGSYEKKQKDEIAKGLKEEEEERKAEAAKAAAGEVAAETASA